PVTGPGSEVQGPQVGRGPRTRMERAMSTSSSRSSPPAPATRQQLDELEALLQRMMDLPVNGIGEDPGTTDQAAGTAPAAAGPAQPAAPRPTYPASYMVVETVVPRPLPRPPGPDAIPPPPGLDLAPRLVPSPAEPGPGPEGGPAPAPGADA